MTAVERIGRYEVEVSLGGNGLGRVVLARDPVLGRQVAVKALRDGVRPADDAARRWTERVTEGAKAAATLHHPGVVAVHDMGTSESERAFVVLELVPGGSLRDRAAAGRLAKNEVASLARALGAALTNAHAAGVVHGNVKAENVLLSPTGPRLTDFGGPHAGGSGLATIASEVLASDKATAEGDQFSLAVTLYEALTGQSPFPGDDAATIAAAVKSAKHPAPTSLAADLRTCPHLDTIFDRALSKDPRRRFASCEAFATALAGSLETPYGPLLTPTSQSSISHSSLSLSSIVPRPTRMRQNAIAAAAIAVIVALVLLGRQRPAAGVSLRSVASAFAVAVEGAPHPATHHRVPSAPASPSATSNAPAPALAPAASTSASGSASGAAPGPSETPHRDVPSSNER